VTNLKGTYALVLALDRETVITVGKLVTFSFHPGYYIYIGSALGGVLPRVRRHIRRDKKLHWHIDYLTREAGVVEVWYLFSEERLECSWYQTVSHMPQACVPVAGFGSSGCRCHSHLVHFSSMPSFEVFRQLLGQQGSDLQKMCVNRENSA
jgi:Uri superfamily endonuclease